MPQAKASLSLFPSLVQVRVAGWWSLSLSLSYLSLSLSPSIAQVRVAGSPSIVKVRVAGWRCLKLMPFSLFSSLVQVRVVGWWSLFLSLSLSLLSLCFVSLYSSSKGGWVSFYR